MLTQKGGPMKEFADSIFFLLFGLMGIFFLILAVKALRTKPGQVGSALRDSVNKFS